ncbi:MAG: hypothetical protein M5U28_43185 [Sandaracinaceae bacterium]|nr:hypothetical protein [Sandaracinaceae bacterium]
MLRENGNYAVVTHVMRSEAALEPAPRPRSRTPSTGGVRIEAEIPHTNEHWGPEDS